MECFYKVYRCFSYTPYSFCTAMQESLGHCYQCNTLAIIVLDAKCGACVGITRFVCALRLAIKTIVSCLIGHLDRGKQDKIVSRCRVLCIRLYVLPSLTCTNASGLIFMSVIKYLPYLLNSSTLTSFWRIKSLSLVSANRTPSAISSVMFHSMRRGLVSNAVDVLEVELPRRVFASSFL